MDFKQLIENLDPDIYQRLKRAVEIGKWPDGRVLTEEQRATSMHAVLAYELEHNVPKEQRVGFLDTGNSSCHSDDGSFIGSDEPSLLKWKQ